MVTARKQVGTRQPITPKNVRDRRATLAVEKAARKAALAETLEEGEKKRIVRNQELQREARLTATKLKAARHLIAINTPRDPVPEPKPKRRPRRRNKKKTAAVTDSIDSMNLFMFIEEGKTVPGASKEDPGVCKGCNNKLVGWPKRKLVVYRQMVPRRFTPAVQYKKIRMMDIDVTRTEIRVANKYRGRVNLAMTWYHLSCLNEAQQNHIREKGARFGKSIDDDLKKNIQKRYKFLKVLESAKQDDVDVEGKDEEGEEDGEEEGEEDTEELGEGSGGAVA